MLRLLSFRPWHRYAAVATLVAGTSGALAQIQFQEVTSQVGITDMGESYGTGFFDANNDGFPEIFGNHHQYTPSVLYLNVPDGGSPGGRRFVDLATDALGGTFNVLTDTHGMETADWDNDGDTDIMEVTGAGYAFPLWENDALGAFTNRVSELGFTYLPGWSTAGRPPTGGRTPLFLDYTGDGRLDVLVTARDNRASYRTPTATFQQTGPMEAPLFVQDETTGVDLVNDVGCHYALLADITDDQVQDVICADSSLVSRVWDVSQSPFLELRSTIGEALYTARPADFAVGDFDGDLRTDLFAPASASAQNRVAMVSDQVIHAWYAPEVSYDTGFNFTADGPVTFELDWWTEPVEVLIGAAGSNPSFSEDLRIFEGQYPVGSPHHLVFTRTPSQAQGIAPRDPLQTKGLYIGVVGGQWQVRFSGNTSWNVGMVIRASNLAGLTVVGDTQLGQPTGGTPYLFMQTPGGQLVSSPGRIAAVNRSCKSAAAGDLDNDGHLDLYVGCVSELSNLPNVVYHNDGTGNFAPVPGAGGAEGQMPEGRLDTVSLGDYDEDGRLDVLLANGHLFRPMSYAGRMQLYRNITNNGNHWVQLDLVGVASNRDGIGAIVYATTPGDGHAQKREQGNGVHKKSQDYKRIHFGLGNQTLVDVEVYWPSGTLDRFPGLAADRVHRLLEGSSQGSVYVLTAPRVSVNEAAGTAVVTVGLEPAPGPGQQVLVDYQTIDGTATAGADYTARSQTLTFGPGVSETAVSIPILNDDLAEEAEAFTLHLTSAQANPVVATVSLVDDDSQGNITCGAPTYSLPQDSALFVWNDCGTSNWHIRATAGGQTRSYQGTLTADPGFTTMSGTSIERGDTMPPPGFTFNVNGAGQDGVNFSFEPGTAVCLTLNLPAGAEILAGANRVPVSGPLTLPGFQPCTPPPSPPECGAPTYDKATEAGAFLWQDCGTSQWHIRVSAGGQDLTYLGTVSSDQDFQSLSGFSIEGADLIDPAPFATPTTGPIGFDLGVGGSGHDGIDFAVGTGADGCIALTTPDGVSVWAGANRVEVGNTVRLSTYQACTP